MKYKPGYDGGWVKPCRKAYRMMCCDCGLVHEMDFRIVDSRNGKKRQVQFRVRRNERATAASRRARVRRGELKLT